MPLCTLSKPNICLWSLKHSGGWEGKCSLGDSRPFGWLLLSKWCLLWWYTDMMVFKVMKIKILVDGFQHKIMTPWENLVKDGAALLLPPINRLWRHYLAKACFTCSVVRILLSLGVVFFPGIGHSRKNHVFQRCVWAW